MRTRRTHAVDVVAALGLAGLVMLTAPPRLRADYDPYLIAKARFHRDVRRVAMRPLRLPLEVEDREGLRSALTGRLLEALGAAGLEVVPPAEFDARWRRFSEILGGVYDPFTGQPDPERLRLVTEYTFRDLSETLDVDAVVAPSLFTRPIRPRDPAGIGTITALGERVHWHGWPLWSTGDGRPQWPQAVMGAWLGLGIRDIEGVELYDIGCAISWRRVYAARSYEDRPESEVYAPERLEAAVARCAGDLARE